MNGSHLALPAMRLGEIVLATGNYEGYEGLVPGVARRRTFARAHPHR
jgi:hypothetical protein